GVDCRSTFPHFAHDVHRPLHRHVRDERLECGSHRSPAPDHRRGDGSFGGVLQSPTAGQSTYGRLAGELSVNELLTARTLPRWVLAACIWASVLAIGSLDTGVLCVIALILGFTAAATWIRGGAMAVRPAAT